jgi:hypothetical protein
MIIIGIQGSIALNEDLKVTRNWIESECTTTQSIFSRKISIEGKEINFYKYQMTYQPTTTEPIFNVTSGDDTSKVYANGQKIQCFYSSENFQNVNVEFPPTNFSTSIALVLIFYPAGIFPMVGIWVFVAFYIYSKMKKNSPKPFQSIQNDENLEDFGLNLEEEIENI